MKTKNGAPGRPAPSGLRIAVDFDGVLFDHIPWLLRAFRDRHGLDLEKEGLHVWDFFHHPAVQRSGLTFACVQKVLHAVESDPLIHQEPLRDALAVAVMADWQAQGHQVQVVTARNPEHRATTEAFLRLHGVPHDGLVMGARIKTGYDVLVDDAPHNVLMAAADGGLALLMDHPYNQDVPTHTNPLRVHDWQEVAQRVQEIEDARAAPARLQG